MPELRMDDWGGDDTEKSTEVYVINNRSGGERGKKVILRGEYNEDTVRELGYVEVDEKDGIPVLLKIGP